MAKEKSNTEAVEFVNPFKEGVNYKKFLKAIPSGVSVEDYCKGNLTQEQINWLVEDIKLYNPKNDSED